MPRPKKLITNPSPIIRELVEIYDASEITQYELARRAGVSQSTLSGMRGTERSYTSVRVAEWVGEALGYHLEWKKNEQPAQQSTSADPSGRSDPQGMEGHFPVPDDKRLRRNRED